MRNRRSARSVAALLIAAAVTVGACSGPPPSFALLPAQGRSAPAEHPLSISGTAGAGRVNACQVESSFLYRLRITVTPVSGTFDRRQIQVNVGGIILSADSQEQGVWTYTFPSTYTAFICFDIFMFAYPSNPDPATLPVFDFYVETIPA